MQTAVGDDIRSALRNLACRFDPAVSARLDRLRGAPSCLIDAMRYSLQAGGKRLRPALVLWCAETCDGPGNGDALSAAMAVECVHTFSLIHDDLPAIDNDDLRRGQPSCHRQFGEALAILAGDALLALAFEILSCDVPDAELSRALSRELAAAAGATGLIGGEVADIEGESMPPAAETVAIVHAAKTARLIEAACVMGGLAAGADPAKISALRAYGRHLGLAFQAADDLLDSTGDSGRLGKPTGRDAAAGKQTYVRIVGVDECRRIAQAQADRAVEALSPFGDDANRLRQLAVFVVDRDS